MKKKTAALLAAVLMAFTAVSCGDGDSFGESSRESSSSLAEVSQGEESSGGTESVSSAPEKSSEAESEPPAESEPAAESEPDPEPVLEPLSTPYAAVEGFEVSGRVTDLAVSSDGKAAVCCSSLKGPEYYVVDPSNGEILHNGDLAGDGEMLLGIRPDGTVVTMNFPEQKIYFYSADSEQPRAMEYPENVVNLKYDAAEDRLIGFKRNISEVDMETGEVTELFGIKETIPDILDVSLTGGYFLANELTVEHNGSDKTEVFSLSDGSKLSELPLYNNALISFTKSGVVCENHDTDDRLFITFDRSTGSTLNCFVSPEESARMISSRYSDHLMMTASNISGDKWESFLKVLDLKAGTLGELHFDGDMVTAFNVTAAPSGRWFAAFTRGERDEDMHTRLIMLEPSLAENPVSVEEVPMPGSEEKEPHEAGEWIAEQKKRADGIEQKYGVEIFLGEEALDIPENSEYKFELQESGNTFPESIDEELDAIETCLSHYPEEFFEYFKKSAGGGLRIAAVESIVNLDEFSSFAAAGLTWETGAWINIAVIGPDLGSDNELLDHELWHAVEYLVERRTPINEVEWSKLDPEGFEYNQNSNTYNTTKHDTEYTLDGSDDPYFIRYYSKMNGYEDRATLIEAIMKQDGKESYRQVSSYPHLKAKLDFLADWIKPYFGYVYFQE